MRKVININNDWKFSKENIGAKNAVLATEKIQLPHTWNGLDGQDGGNDYYRGTCWYVRDLPKIELANNEQAYLEFKGVNSSAAVFLNGKQITSHDGGYSTFRVDVTKLLQEKNSLVVGVDNSKNETVYPQTADFTFYGGIYRDVNIVIVNENHFNLDYFGACGLQAKATLNERDGIVEARAFVKGSGLVRVSVLDADKKVVAVSEADSKRDEPLVLKVENAKKWEGVESPYLYSVCAQLVLDGAVVDEVAKNIGFRTFRMDNNEGFFLNGRKYPLRGVCRHQDRPKIGNALSKACHEEDIALIREVGANTVRLAHYQHDDYFYDLCDINGIVVWAEIPYISKHMNNADDNAISQMKELIFQQYHHPSIVAWGLSNEITMHRADSDRFEFHKIINNMCHELDDTRQTAIACYMPCMNSNKLNAIPDLVSYNLYFGWYFPCVFLAGIKLDRYHSKYKNRVIGLAEYGAEGMPNLHSSRPHRGDNTEEYQTIYHEKMLKIIEKRDYIWATHLWNMFDFAADARNQGGEAGMNHKGLVTFDRKTKKDAFYLYKAYWSKEPFVHICGKRFVNRTGKFATIKVYSNSDKVELFNNNQLVGTVSGSKIFVFKIELNEINSLEARTGSLVDASKIVRVKSADKAYKVKKTKTVSWQKK